MQLHRKLVFYRAGLLDPAERHDFEQLLLRSPELQAQLASLDSRWSPEVDVEVPRWRVPPPGLGVGARAGLPAVFSESTLRPGDRFTVRIDPLTSPEAHRVVIMQRLGRDWDVVFPKAPHQSISLDQLPLDEDGCFQLDLVARAPGGRQRWAVALPWERSMNLTWSHATPDWDWLRMGVASGQIPVASVDIEVREAA
ncbi:MAG: hypothetical protein H6741_29550 [Alphaproteobacteria bacterium]|nr:hypothetical protein [Alphaproteobacteria bacterium]MCB9796867.1 hypothetical protein [Alphaproteobacteria bacterium]